MNVLILGANGFIGSNLCEAILKVTDWNITAIDLQQDKLKKCIGHERFSFTECDITLHKEKIVSLIKACDVVLPLVAIATPATYVQDPLRIFELDFEANIEIIRHCVSLKTRIIFPSTSEVYGMCPDSEFDEEASNFVTGPIHKERWIYSTSKQLLDRVIYAYGKHHALSYTLFRPFNWFGPGQDNILNPKPGGSRAIPQFIGNILRGENIALVDGGAQQRSFTYIDDGIKALIQIIKNKDNCAQGKIYNLGFPTENFSIRQLAQMLVRLIHKYPAYRKLAEQTQLIDVSAEKYYGSGYQDVLLRVPSIARAKKDLNWQPEVGLEEGLMRTLDFYLEHDVSYA